MGDKNVIGAVLEVRVHALIRQQHQTILALTLALIFLQVDGCGSGEKQGIRWPSEHWGEEKATRRQAI